MAALSPREFSTDCLIQAKPEREAKVRAMHNSEAPSLWLDQVTSGTASGHGAALRSPLTQSASVDIVIVGAGYTGLWSAYYLAKRLPDASIAIVESKTVGFGASGRNGGWCIAELANDYGGAMHHPMVETVDEIERVIAAEAIDCDFARGGELHLARNAAQVTRLRDDLSPDYEWLDAAEAQKMCGASRVLGGAFTPQTAALHPAKLVRGLAEAVEAQGTRIYEGTRAQEVTATEVVTATGTLNAEHVVLATEGYTAQLAGYRRDLIPFYSLMIATEPLGQGIWDEIGLDQRPTFTDGRYRVIYGQRTADDRIAFGGRAAPYRMGSKIDPAVENSPATHEEIRETLVDLFPVLSETAITHRWGGVLGVPRNWKPAVSNDEGLYRAGGYVGEGVAATNLAGQTIADLISGDNSELTRLPWVRPPSRRWPIEPFRWAGIMLGAELFERADRREMKTGQPAKEAGLVWSLLRR